MVEVRLQKHMAQCGIASRRQAEAAVQMLNEQLEQLGASVLELGFSDHKRDVCRVHDIHSLRNLANDPLLGDRNWCMLCSYHELYVIPLCCQCS